MAAVMWGIRRRYRRYKHGWRVPISTIFFTGVPGDTGKEQSWMTRLFAYHYHLSFIENLLSDPSRMITISLTFRMELILRVSVHSC